MEIHNLLGDIEYGDIPDFGKKIVVASMSPTRQFRGMFRRDLDSTYRGRGISVSKTLRLDDKRKRGISAPIKKSEPEAFHLEATFEDKEDEGELELLSMEMIEEIVDEETVEAMVIEEAPSEKATELMPERMKKPEQVTNLERILSLAYHTKVDITSINELPLSRKQVKEVYFHKNGLLQKVWILKADPKQTARELAIYHIANKQGVPTGKPVGFEPNIAFEKYPYDIAILGGVVENAGYSYDELISNMNLSPDLIHNIAKTMSKLIADYHRKLTIAETEFEKYGIKIEKASPRKEIKERFAAGVGIDEKRAEELIRTCEELYEKQEGEYVISHGDIHTGNIVTRLQDLAVQIENFGIIDWGSIVWDKPYGDMMDYWIHHQRKASDICDMYNGYDFRELDRAYKTSSGHNLKHKDSIIQSVLWNLYEMYDPLREDADDIQHKATIHCKSLSDDLNRLKMIGLGEDAYKIKRKLNRLLNGKLYLRNFLQH